MRKLPMEGIISMTNGMIIHAAQNNMEFKKLFITVIPETSHFLFDNLRFRKYIEIDEHR